MKRTILLITLIAVGFVWAQADTVVVWPIPTTPAYDTIPVSSQYGTPPPRIYLPVVTCGIIDPTPVPTSTPGAGPPTPGPTSTPEPGP